MKTTNMWLLFAGLLLSALLSSAQQITLSNCIGGIESEKARDFKTTSDGGYIIVGYTETPEGMTSSTNHGGRDVYVTKLNAAGEAVWQKNFGGSADDEGQSIIQTPNNEYIIVSTSYSNDGDIIDHHGDMNNSDVWLFSLNQSGQIIWSKSYGSESNETAVDISLSGTNRFMIAGSRLSEDVENEQLDYWVAQLDFNGNTIWENYYGGEQNDILQTMLWASGDDVYLGGSSYSFGTNDLDGETYIVKIDQYGDVIWEIHFGSSSDTGTGDVNSMCLNEDEVITISRISALQPDEYSCGAHGSFQYARISTEGEVLEHWCYGGTGTDKSVAVCADSDGTHWLLGTTNSSDGDVNPASGYEDEETDVWLAKTDEEGNILWNTSLGGTLEDEAVNIYLLENGSLAILANTNSSDGSTVNQHGNSGESFDTWLIKIDPLASLIESFNLQDEIKLFPVPASHELTLAISERAFENQHYKITDMLGKEIFSGLMKTNSIRFNLDSLEMGLYHLQLTDASGKVFASSRFLKE